MKPFRLALVCCASLLVSELAGCGSSGPSAPYTLACSAHRLPGGRIRATVTINNTTDVAGSAIVYGPALQFVRHAYPALAPQPVKERPSPGGIAVSYVGLRVPRIPGGKSTHVLLRFAPPARPLAMGVTGTNSVNASDYDPLTNGACTIQGTR